MDFKYVAGDIDVSHFLYNRNKIGETAKDNYVLNENQLNAKNISYVLILDIILILHLFVCSVIGVDS